MFHDLRHTAKTYLRKAGVDRNIRMVILGHSDGNDMDSHYDTMDEGDLIDAIDRVELYLREIEYQKNSHY